MSIRIYAIILLKISISVFGQEFYIKDKDTLPYQLTINIENGDTFYFDPCFDTCITFEKKVGFIINQRDKHGLRQGHWIFPESAGNYKTAEFKNNEKIGLWKHFDKSGKLLFEDEVITINHKLVTIQEIDYSSGKAITKINKPFLGFCEKYKFYYLATFFLIFLIRVFINSKIYNIENGTSFSPVYGPFLSQNFEHSLFCTFTFWFSSYKSVNKRLVMISNTLSILVLVLFFGQLIGLAIEGDI